MPRGVFDHKAAAAKRLATMARRKAERLADEEARRRLAEDPFGFPDETPAPPEPPKPEPPKEPVLPGRLASIQPVVVPNPNDQLVRDFLTEVAALRRELKDSLRKTSAPSARTESTAERIVRLTAEHDAWKTAKHLFSGNPEERTEMDFCENVRKNIAEQIRELVRDHRRKVEDYRRNNRW